MIVFHGDTKFLLHRKNTKKSILKKNVKNMECVSNCRGAYILLGFHTIAAI